MNPIAAWVIALICAVGPATRKDAGDGQLQARLVAAYPEQLLAASGDGILWRDGTWMPFREPRGPASPRSDLRTQMEQPYPAGPLGLLKSAPTTDPGRNRSEPFFRKMYGADQSAVEAHLVSVPWLPRRGGRPMRVTRVNSVDRRLRAISDALEALSPGDTRCAVLHAGAQAWRNIAGTTDLSPHSFGIAIDLEPACSDYWRWEPNAPHPWTRRPLRFSDALVEVFERHGFIWGAKWLHFDTMHFEYRPELLRPIADLGSLP